MVVYEHLEFYSLEGLGFCEVLITLGRSQPSITR